MSLIGADPGDLYYDRPVECGWGVRVGPGSKHGRADVG